MVFRPLPLFSIRALQVCAQRARRKNPCGETAPQTLAQGLLPPPGPQTSLVQGLASDSPEVHGLADGRQALSVMKYWRAEITKTGIEAERGGGTKPEEKSATRGVKWGEPCGSVQEAQARVSMCVRKAGHLAPSHTPPPPPGTCSHPHRPSKSPTQPHTSDSHKSHMTSDTLPHTFTLTHTDSLTVTHLHTHTQILALTQVHLLTPSSSQSLSQLFTHIHRHIHINSHT